jgi:nucleoid DNA-binding protein
MTQKTIYKIGAIETGLSEETIKTVLNWFFYIQIPHVIFTLGEKIHFRGCGFWELSYRKNSVGRNFASGERIEGGPRYRVAFRAKDRYLRKMTAEADQPLVTNENSDGN